MSKVSLTTIDNPYSPVDEFKKWYMYDILESKPIKELGLTQGCCEILASRAYTSDQFTEEENNEIIEETIDEIIAEDIFSVYKKLVHDQPKNA